MQYVGQTVLTLHERWKGHVQSANAGIKWEFPKAIREHGPDNFVGRVVCECETPEELATMEDHWMHELNTLWPNGYNMRDGTNFVCDQTRQLISERAKKAMSDPELRAYLSDRAKARPVRVENIEAMARVNRGKKRSAETIKKLKRPHTVEHNLAVSRALKGKPLSLEHRETLSRALKGKPISEAARAARTKRHG
jgi:hypothetical protein